MDEKPQSIKAAFQQITQKMDGKIMEAKVISVSPLTVQAIGDEKLILQEATLIVPRHLTDYDTTATFSLGVGSLQSVTEGSGTHSHAGGSHGGHQGGDGSHAHSGDGGHNHHLVSFHLSEGTITIHNALKVGEIVYLLPFNDSKKYYILDRK